MAALLGDCFGVLTLIVKKKDDGDHWYSRM